MIELIEDAKTLEKEYPAAQHRCAYQLAQQLGRPFLLINQLRNLLKLPDDVQQLFLTGRLRPSRLDAVASAIDPYTVAKDVEHRDSLAYKLCPNHIASLARQCVRTFGDILVRGEMTATFRTCASNWQPDFRSRIGLNQIEPTVRELVRLSEFDKGRNLAEMGLATRVLYLGDEVSVTFELMESGRDETSERGRGDR